MKKYGFWHIALINNYFDVISEQLKIIIDSGLYSECSNIFVGCVGENISETSNLFSHYPKIKILSHKRNLKEFEFATLSLLHEKSKTEPPFYGFYFHTKGVSYPDNEGGKHWRDYMNYFNLKKWVENVKKLDEGFQTCGVKFIKDGFPPHYSGNFFWFNSEYTRTLAPITKLNKKDRYAAEMWLCSNYPKVACLCDKFVDYKTKGEFVPPAEIEAKEVVLEVPKEVKVQEPIAEVVIPQYPKWSQFLEQYPQGDSTEKIRQRMDRFQEVAEDYVKHYYLYKNESTDQMFENLSRLLKNSSSYYIK